MQFPKVFLYQFCSYMRLTNNGERWKPYFMRVSEIGKWDETVISSEIKNQKRSRKIGVEWLNQQKMWKCHGMISDVFGVCRG